MIGRQRKTCDNGNAHHGRIALPEAITVSCDIFFYTVGIATGPAVIATQARRFHLDQPTGIELPGETHRMLIPDPDWMKKARNVRWTDGDTANIAIGQGDVQVTPLEMACFAASFARGETTTRPTLLHDPNRPPQHSEPIGLTPSQYSAIVQGNGRLHRVRPRARAGSSRKVEGLRVPGIRIAGKDRNRSIAGKIQHGLVHLLRTRSRRPGSRSRSPSRATLRETIPWRRGNSAPVAAVILKKYFEKERGAPASPAGTHF